MIYLDLICVLLNIIGFGNILFKCVLADTRPTMTKYCVVPAGLAGIYFITYLIALLVLGPSSVITIIFLVLSTVIWVYILGQTPKPQTLKANVLKAKLEREVVNKLNHYNDESH